MPRLLPLSLALLLSLGLAACGKRGPLEPPPGTGPAQSAAKADEKAAGAKAGPAEEPKLSGEAETSTKLGTKKRVPIVPPKRDLIIDRILD